MGSRDCRAALASIGAARFRPFAVLQRPWRDRDLYWRMYQRIAGVRAGELFSLAIQCIIAYPRVFAYLRVSTAEQAANGDSLATQRQQIAGYAMMRGWPEPEWFIDRGVSGSVPLADRPEGKRLLEAVETGDVIITAKLDRAFRSAADALGTLEELKDQGVGLHMIDLGGDVTGNGISKLVFTILSAVAENERDRIRERIRDVKRHLASQGIYGGGKRPFGYNVVDGRLVTNANERRAIARMRALHAEGKPLREISKLIANEFKVEMTAMTIKRILDRYIDAGQPATLQHEGCSVPCFTVQEAVIALKGLPPARQQGATIKVGDRVYSPDEIDLLHLA
jgi:putative DNA-invertase from lambdoid prophage Rac